MPETVGKQVQAPNFKHNGISNTMPTTLGRLPACRAQPLRKWSSVQVRISFNFALNYLKFWENISKMLYFHIKNSQKSAFFRPIILSPPLNLTETARVRSMRTFNYTLTLTKCLYVIFLY